MFYLKTLGQLCLHREGPDGDVIISSAKPLAVPAILTALPEPMASREYIAELLWPGVQHGRARQSLRQALFQLSRKAHPELLITEDSQISLNTTLLQVDLHVFQRALSNQEYEAAIRVCEGRFLEGFEDGAHEELRHWIEVQNERIRAGLEIAFTHAIDGRLESGDPDTAVAYARRFASLNPLDDLAQSTLVRTLKAAGDEVGALQAYQAFRALLKDALDDEPPDQLSKTVEPVRAALLSETANGESSAVAHRVPEFSPLRDSERAAERIRHPERRLGSLGKMLAAGAAGAGLVTLGVFAVEVWSGGAAESDRLDRFYAQLAGAAATGEIVLTGDDVRIGRRLQGQHVLPSPDGSLAAMYHASANGWNVALRNLRTGELRQLTDRPLDEAPLAWSPDGRYLLHSRGDLIDGRTYRVTLAVADVTTGHSRPLTATPLISQSAVAAWSPDGTRIAFTGEEDGSPQVFVINVDGTGQRKISSGMQAARDPAWAPDGDRVAFSGRPSGGSFDIFVVRPDGSEPRRLLGGPTDEISPAWLSDFRLLYLSDFESVGKLSSLDLRTGRVERVSEAPPLHRIWVGPGRDSTWVEEVRIQPRLETVTPGVQFRPAARVEAADGSTIAPQAIPVGWRISDPEILQLVDDSTARVSALGEVGLIATAGGWRSDTLTLRSRPLVVRDPEPALTETWRRGIRPERWIVFGDPLPYSRPEGGPQGGGIFVSNGDESFPSGAITRRSFDTTGGLTVEVWGRMPFSGDFYEDYSIDLYETAPPADSLDWREGAPLIRFVVSGRSMTAFLNHIGVKREAVPLPDDVSSWHRYALQLNPDGALSLAVDGRLWWRASWRVDLERHPRFHVGLGHQALAREIQHGPLRVFTESKYVVPRPEDPSSTLNSAVTKGQ